MTRAIGRGSTWSVAALALALALPAQAAPLPSPPPPCLSEAELRAMTAFALPGALDGLAAHCAPHLAANSYLRGNGARLVGRYAAGKAAAWPRARTAFLKFAGQTDRQNTDLIAQMPDAALQPFVEAMIGGLVAAKLKPAQCGVADKVVRLLAPLPPENTVELLGTLVALSTSEAGKGSPAPLALCPG